MRKILSLAMAAGFGAAAMISVSTAKHHEEEDAGPDPRIGEEVDRICFQRNIDGWKALKGVDNVVLLERGVNKWYYVELTGACRSSMLRSALTIGIDSRPAGGCVSRGDVIIVNDSPGFTHRCFIQNIYEWDEDAAREEEPSEEMTDEEVMEE